MTVNTAAKNTAVTALMAAILITSKFALSFVPNVEIVTPLIIIFTCKMGFKRTFFATLVFCAADNLLYTFDYMVTIQYLIHWPLLCVLSALTYKYIGKKAIIFAFLGLFSALLFWVETPAIWSLLKFAKFWPSLYSGILFMLFMAPGDFIFTLLAFKPLCNALDKVCKKIFDN
jgi:energy-coupling factor transport system substrate-specific component